ncbi:hypothetical protein HUJ04_007456 [Dendroctonus ponderosae]|nr:hypothetical protein HUJ04_007456 [Dendroctonus ponderosae]
MAETLNRSRHHEFFRIIFVDEKLDIINSTEAGRLFKNKAEVPLNIFSCFRYTERINASSAFAWTAKCFVGGRIVHLLWKVPAKVKNHSQLAVPSIPVAATSKPKITPLQPHTTTANPTTKKLNNPKKSSSSTTIQTTTTQWPTDTHESSSIHSDSYSISSTEENGSSDIQLSTESESTTEDAKSCIVMGEEYKVGDSLPHSTGNCLECICGQGGKITCSPHQCEPAGDEINDYRQPDSRQGNDGFK